MSAPQTIWVEPALAREFARQVNDPTEISYTRTDLLPPPAAEYVAGLEAAAKKLSWAYKEASVDEIPGLGEALRIVRALIAARPASPDTQTTTLPDADFERFAAAVSKAEIASPDTRVVTVAQLEALYWLAAGCYPEETNRCAREIRAIIDGGQDRG